MASAHLIFHGIKLYFESYATKTSYIDYMAACYNARQGWIPRREDFSLKFDKNLDADEIKFDD